MATIIIRLSDDDKKQIDDYCKATGRKVGPWLKLLALQEVPKEKAK